MIKYWKKWILRLIFFIVFFFVVRLLCKNLYDGYTLGWDSLKTIQNYNTELSPQDQLKLNYSLYIRSNKRVSFSKDVDSVLFHPTSMQILWAKLEEGFVVRRLAYFDKRDKSDFAVVFLSMHDDRKWKFSVYAQLIYKNRDPICSRLKYWTKSNGLNYEYKEWYINYMLRTIIKIPRFEPPLYARIGLGKECTGPMYDIPVKDDKQKQNLTYGVCLHKGLFNLHDPQLLVDWVELHIALGAEIITIYIQNVAESYYTVMKPYIDKGIVEILDWKLKPPLIPGYTSDWGQSGVVNECIYRNLYRVKYLALLDVDEFIMPLKKRTVMEMIYDLEKNYGSTYASYSFFNTPMYDDGVMLPEVKSVKKCSNLTWPRYYRFTLQMNDYKSRSRLHTKLIVKVAAINAAWYHWLKSSKKGFKSRLKVPWTDGVSYHYRFPELKREIKTKRSFIVSRYFNQTLQHLRYCKS